MGFNTSFRNLKCCPHVSVCTMYVYHQNDQSVKKIWIEISIRKKKLNKFWAVGWQMGKVIVLPFQCILFQYQIIMILQMGNVLSFLTLLLYWTKLHNILIPVSIIFSIIFSTTYDEFAVSRGWPVPRPSLHPLLAPLCGDLIVKLFRDNQSHPVHPACSSECSKLV